MGWSAGSKNHAWTGVREQHSFFLSKDRENRVESQSGWGQVSSPCWKSCGEFQPGGSSQDSKRKL